jgi:hypothetical protein
MYSWKWSICIAPFFSALVFFFYWSAWDNAKSVWVLEPLFSVPFACGALPACFGLMFSAFEKDQKMLNIIGFAIAISGVISGILVFALPMTDPQYFFPGIEYTY